MKSVHLTANDVTRLREKCNNAINDINWTNTADLTNCDYKRALQLAREGQDGGPTATKRFEPTNNNHHKWMKYAHLLTVLYNRNRSVKRFTILRKGWEN